MSNMYAMFPTPVIRVPASQSNYDAVQLEVQAAYKKIQEIGDTTAASYLYKDSTKTELSKKTYDFIEKYNCEKLKLRILEATNEYVQQVGWQGPTNFVIKQSWINITNQHGLHSGHCHPGYALSGTYYFRVSNTQGSICFNNPNPAMFYCNFPQGAMCPQTVDIVPDDGDIVLFPSWLIHSTRPNRLEEHRISIAFNIDFVGGDEVAFGLNKESHIPYHKSESSLKGVINKL
tara:strand:- start:5362 stop:6057 length:696 start_codon:yes stop_codon:yes gene_type:complete